MDLIDVILVFGCSRDKNQNGGNIFQESRLSSFSLDTQTVEGQHSHLGRLEFRIDDIVNT